MLKSDYFFNFLLTKTDVYDIIEDVKKRDYNDSHRAVSPLVKADDAIEVDTTYLDIDKSLEAIKKIIDHRNEE